MPFSVFKLKIQLVEVEEWKSAKLSAVVLFYTPLPACMLPDESLFWNLQFCVPKMLKAIIQSSSLHFGKFCISETFQRHYYGNFFEVQARMPVPMKIFFVAQKTQ